MARTTTDLLSPHSSLEPQIYYDEAGKSRVRYVVKETCCLEGMARQIGWLHFVLALEDWGVCLAESSFRWSKKRLARFEMLS